MSTDPYDVPEVPPALGSVVETGRGSLPFALIHGEALVACASWALGDSGVTPVDLGTQWAGLVDSGEPYVVHDVLCPMTPAPFIAACVRRAVEADTVVVGSDAEGHVLSPVVLPARVLAALAPDDLAAALTTPDLDALVDLVSAHGEPHRETAPASAARVRSLDDVQALERLTSPEPT
ncbi:MAG: 2-C-methyl-D-erythritol 4-phosphate cytidylyltransferase [Nocardioides sp.]